MKLLVVLLISLALNCIQATIEGGTTLKCLASSCQGCASDPNCVWCDNRCIDKNAYVLCSKRISDSSKCQSKVQAKTCCEYKGQRYDFGEKFMDDCNNCTCLSSGSVSCTEKLCSGGSTLGCENVRCMAGYTFPAGDGCNSCNCVSGQVSCTEMACLMSCLSDNDCNSGHFCEKDSCDDNDSGICTQCNADMICTTQHDPVCGCDDRSYTNSCEAAKSCVNVKYSGECQSDQNQPQQTSCLTDNDCSSGSFCSKTSCDASMRGTCTVCNRDSICNTLFDPVCGCDDNTYSNQCDATRSCVNVKTRGQCQSTTTPQPQQLNCRSNTDCTAGYYCAKETCDCDQGTCTQRSLGCNTLNDPVCGCDGKTYNNQCEACRLGANVKSHGQCSAGGKTTNPHH